MQQIKNTEAAKKQKKTCKNTIDETGQMKAAGTVLCLPKSKIKHKQKCVESSWKLSTEKADQIFQ